MNTIFARWTAVKAGLQAEVIRLDASIQEADAIIKAGCGQERQGYYNLPDCAISIYSKYILGLDIRHIQPQKHCNHSLKTAEELLAKARTITTGSLIEAWEKSQ